MTGPGSPDRRYAIGFRVLYGTPHTVRVAKGGRRFVGLLDAVHAASQEQEKPYARSIAHCVVDMDHMHTVFAVHPGIEINEPAVLTLRGKEAA